MINDTPQPESPPVVPSEPVPEPPSISPDAVPSQPVAPKESRKKLWKILGISFSVLTCCCLVGVAAFVIVSINAAKEKAPIEKVLDSYMYGLKVKNAESAYALFSTRAKRQVPLSKVQQLLEGNNYVLFEGYQSLSVSTAKISAAGNTNPDKPQGTIAVVSGTISYQDGSQGSFNGTLEKEDDKWRIHGISVTVPPSKFK